MNKTYLKEYEGLVKTGVVYVPVGTLEWHGHQLPIETDALLAQALCERVSKKVKGYVLPPFYLGTDNVKTVKGKKLRGMDASLGRKLPGNIYWLEPKTFEKVLSELVSNLIGQGFKYVFIITGHAGEKHLEVIRKVESKFKQVYLARPKMKKPKISKGHAAEGEISLFLGYYPEEVKRIKKIKLSDNDEYVKYRGWDPMPKIDIDEGKRMVKARVCATVKLVKSKIR